MRLLCRGTWLRAVAAGIFAIGCASGASTGALAAKKSKAKAAPSPFAADLQTCARGSGDAAIAACTRLIENDKLKTQRRGPLYGRRAVERVNKMQYAEALADYDETLRLHPRFAIAYVARGTVHGYTGDSERAIADYTKAIEINGKLATAYTSRGHAYNARDNATAAIVNSTKPSSSTHARPSPMAGAATPIARRANSIARSPIIPRRSSSARIRHRSTTLAATPTATRATTNARSPTTPRPSSATPRWSMPMTIAA